MARFRLEWMSLVCLLTGAAVKRQTMARFRLEWMSLVCLLTGAVVNFRPNGTYEFTCSEVCGHCFGANNNCNHVNGKCASSCRNGWTGDQCKVLPNGTYEFTCSEAYGHCSGANNNCNHVNGKCASSCRNGWTGDQCKVTECEDGKFGPQCSSFCKCKNPDEVCNKTTGHCSSGCTDGYTGEGCQMHCMDGYYGSACRRCGKCLENSPCDKQTGLCTDGCQPGWKGDNCHEGKIAKSSSIKVFDFVESTAPITLHGDPEVTQDGSLASCVTVTGRQPSWKMTLDSEHIIYGVGIYMAEGDVVKIHVEVDDRFCYHGNVSEPINSCAAPVEGKSVKIYVPVGDNINNLTLCEVNVYATPEDPKPIISVPTIPITLGAVGAAVLLFIAVVFVILRCKRNNLMRDRPEADRVVYTETVKTDHQYNDVGDNIYLEPVADDAREGENHYEVVAGQPVDGTRSATVEDKVYVNDSFQAERSTYSQLRVSDIRHYEVMPGHGNN